MEIFKTINEEIQQYKTGNVEISDGCYFSQYKLVKRISLYENQQYPKGKLDSQQNYKYWYDIISPRVGDEIKNIDFDRNNILVYSDSDRDALAIFISNLWLKSWMNKTGQGEKLNDSVEEFSSWGNVVWKKVKNDYEKVDLKNVYVLNQTAESLKDSPVIERHQLIQSELREKEGVWKNVEKVIETCGRKDRSSTIGSGEVSTSTPYYEIYERNGEVNEKALFEAQGKKGGSDKKYVLAKIIIAVKDKRGTIGEVLFAEKIDEMPYKEAHRGRYKGKWFREGLYEVLFDCQTRANEIGNQIARGLEWASKTIFRSSDTLIVQNILTDLRSGDIIKSKELQQVETRMQGMDQLMADWNRNLQVADKLANSYEVVSGETLPSNTPFKLGNLLDTNANKLFDFIREKLSLAFEDLIGKWILPVAMKELRVKEIIDLGATEANLEDYYKMLVGAWYVKNIIFLPPHSVQDAQLLKDQKLQEIKSSKKPKNLTLKVESGFWNNFKPRIKVIISGENVKLATDLETFYSFIQLESDPIRRTALIEMAMKKKNVDVSNLPKSPPMPQQVQPAAVAAEQSNQASIK